MFRELIVLTVTLGLMLSTNACKTESTGETIEVQYAGALRNMMHKGDISAKIELSDLAQLEHLYALGAIENLKGEVQIFDGQAWNTIVSNDSLVFDKTFSKNATLLVYAQVEAWESIEIPSTIRTRKDLEQFIEESATQQAINTDAPFPFLLEGQFRFVDWHVINWKDGDTEHSHEKHIQSGLHGRLENIAMKALGFYSERHKGIFTHHTANTHIHMKTADGQVAGHIDDLELGEHVLLKLPTIKQDEVR